MPADPNPPEMYPPLGEPPGRADAWRCDNCGQPWPCKCDDPVYVLADPEHTDASEPPPWTGEFENTDA